MNMPLHGIMITSNNGPDWGDVHDQIAIDSSDMLYIINNKLAVGWSVKETIGNFIVNKRAINNLIRNR